MTAKDTLFALLAAAIIGAGIVIAFDSHAQSVQALATERQHVLDSLQHLHVDSTVLALTRERDAANTAAQAALLALHLQDATIATDLAVIASGKLATDTLLLALHGRPDSLPVYIAIVTSQAVTIAQQATALTDLQSQNALHVSREALLMTAGQRSDSIGTLWHQEADRWRSEVDSLRKQPVPTKWLGFLPKLQAKPCAAAVVGIGGASLGVGLCVTLQ